MQEWVKKKAKEDTTRVKREERRQLKAKSEKEEKDRKGAEAFKKWIKLAQNRPRTAPNSYGYSAGKLTGKH